MKNIVLRLMIGWNPDMRPFAMVSVVFRLALGFLLLTVGATRLTGDGDLGENLMASVERDKAMFRIDPPETFDKNAPTQDFLFKIYQKISKSKRITTPAPKGAKYRLPEPLLSAAFYCMPFIVILLGVSLVVGLFTRASALALALFFVISVFGLHSARASGLIPGVFVLIGATLAVYICSPGDLLSLDGMIFRNVWREEKKKSSAPAAQPSSSPAAQPPSASDNQPQ
ncbi:MAG: DoxX family protein [Planctomycetota bacterium]